MTHPSMFALQGHAQSGSDDRAPSTSEYRDFSQEQEHSGDLAASNQNGTNREQSFPMKLHYMLSDMQADGLDHMVSWQPHGRCFVVHNSKLFVAQILPL